MMVNLSNPNSIPKTLDSPAAPESGLPTRSPAAPSSVADGLNVSLSGQSVQQLQSSLQNLPPIRKHRVEALRQAIQSGKFSVNPQKLANTMGADLFGAAFSSTK